MSIPEFSELSDTEGDLKDIYEEMRKILNLIYATGYLVPQQDSRALHKNVCARFRRFMDNI